MKKLLYLFIAASAAISCTIKKDYYKNINTPPVLTVSTEGNSYSDTAVYRRVKLRSVDSYSFMISEKAEILIENPATLSIEIDDSIKITSLEAGKHQAFIRAVDEFGEESSIELNYTVYENEKPVAVAEAKQVTDGFSPYEIHIDASQSTDDSGIASYIYKIGNNYEIKTDLDAINYICSSKGQKKISVSVVDIDGEISEANEFFLSVNEVRSLR